MATIHSLPIELIRHTLSLAYPPGQQGSGAGLCSTAVVHSTWREPSVSIMTERMRFSPDGPASLERFITDGPIEWVAQRVEFDRCEMSQMMAALARAKPGAIRSFEAWTSTEPIPAELFAQAGLSGKCTRPLG